jgi:hypothetical protein
VTAMYDLKAMHAAAREIAWRTSGGIDQMQVG